MIDLDRARTVFLDHYNQILERSRPFGDVMLPGRDASHLMHVTDLVWIKHILDDVDLSAARRDAWAARINHDQEPATGLFRYPPGTDHIDEHATWQCVAALNMLGRQPAHRLTCVASLLDADRFREWCDSYAPPASHHRFMLAVIAAASRPPDGEWRAVFCDWYDGRQDPESGVPFGVRGSRSLSPAFLLTAMRLALSGSVPRADRIVQTVLGFQNDWGGVTASDLPGYMEMDAAFLLHRLASSVESYADRIDACLARMGQFIDHTLADADRRARLLDDPHRALAVCGNLSVLWRHFGTCGDRPTPFPWAELEHFRAPL